MGGVVGFGTGAGVGPAATTADSSTIFLAMHMDMHSRELNMP